MVAEYHVFERVLYRFLQVSTYTSALLHYQIRHWAAETPPFASEPLVLRLEGDCQTAASLSTSLAGALLAKRLYYIPPVTTQIRMKVLYQGLLRNRLGIDED